MLRVVLCVALIAAGAFADVPVIPPPHPDQPTAAPNSTTTSTTTAKPTSTSTLPPTTSKTTPTPTPPPSTSSVAPPTPPPINPPTPAPDNKPGTWNVTQENNKTIACVVASMCVNIVVPYVKVDPKNASVLTNATEEIKVPSSAIASGSCGNASQSLILTWKVGELSLNLTFDFEKNNKSEFTLKSVKSVLPADKLLFPDIVANSSDFKLTSLNASAPIPVHQSYLCAAGVNFTLDNPKQEAAPVVPTLVLTHVQFQAFAQAKENKFDAAVDCASVPYVTPDIVPIAVGVSLAALVAVVLVAYVIGRRRSAARGYLSM